MFLIYCNLIFRGKRYGDGDIARAEYLLQLRLREAAYLAQTGEVPGVAVVVDDQQVAFREDDVPRFGGNPLVVAREGAGQLADFSKRA